MLRPAHIFVLVMKTRYNTWDVMALKVALKLEALYFAINATKVQLTMREMIKIVRRHAKFSESMSEAPKWSHVALSLLLPQVEGSEDEQKVLKAVRSVDGWESDVVPNYADQSASIEIHPEGGAIFREGSLYLKFFELDLEYWKHNQHQPAPMIRKLVQCIFAVDNKEPVLLVGPTSFKTEVTKVLGKLLGRQDEVVTLHLTGETETHDLLGQVEPASFKELIKMLLRVGDELFARYKLLTQGLERNVYEIQQEKASVQMLRTNFQKKLLDFSENGFATDSTANSDVIDGRSSGSWEQESMEPPSRSSSSSLASTEAESNEDEGASLGLSEPLEHSEIGSESEGSSDVLSGIDSDDDDALCSEVGGNLDEEHDIVQHMSESASEVHDDPKGRTEAVGETEWAFDTVHKSKNLSVSTGSESVDSSTNHFIPEEVSAAVEDVLQQLGEMIGRAFSGDIEPGLSRLLHRFKTIWKEIQGTDPLSGDPVFMFMDGPVPHAISVGQIFVIEDFDKSKQAVTERLNRVTDVDPVFCIPEDITGSTSGSYKEIQVPSTFRLIATIHSEGPRWNSNLSTATKSRFTAISVPDYSQDDLQQLIASEIRAQSHEGSKMEPETIARHVLELRQLVRAESGIREYNDVHQLFRWVDFLCNDSVETGIENRIVLGGKYFYLDELEPEIQNILMKKWWQKLGFADDMPPYLDPKAMMESQDQENVFKVKYLEDNSAYGIELTYAGLIGKFQTPEVGTSDSCFQERLQGCTLIPSYLMNCARIFAAIAAKSAGLLVGPPGIGEFHLSLHRKCKLTSSVLSISESQMHNQGTVSDVNHVLTVIDANVC